MHVSSLSPSNSFTTSYLPTLVLYPCTLVRSSLAIMSKAYCLKHSMELQSGCNRLHGPASSPHSSLLLLASDDDDDDGGDMAAVQYELETIGESWRRRLARRLTT